ncbi:hypothetical protein [Streptomyces sp. NEAU-YJ-81]|uniref:hypothetical protein n=1 Tax=Streptomyces sp. NEAU-YJ-81 TaxID=2820288 RepID=UPI001ABC082F|nr:hypothetical protein [Streptomyces sp. NEAU-YJ-81]MBO3681687.1 hypothetical protein [Streptomyces sp. NEAU-YJ-81]
MDNPTTRIRNSTQRPANSPPTTPAGPGETTLRTALGNDGYATLRRHRHITDTALGPLADLLWATARETDRLHTELHYYASCACDHLRHASTHADHADDIGLLQHASRAIDMHANRYVQQRTQLHLALDAYKLALLTA